MMDVRSRVTKKKGCKKETAEKAGPNKVAGRQPRTAEGKFIKFGGFSFSKRNKKTPASRSRNKFSTYVGSKLNGKTLARADYKTTVQRFRAIWQARQRRTIDEAAHGAGGLASKVNKLFGAGRSKKKKEAALTIEKESLRWRLIASTPYGPDKDGQWVTEKALKSWAEAHPDGGVPLVWWHLVSPQQERVRIELGQSDKAYYTGDALVMEGTFIDSRIGNGLLAHTDELGSSIGFKYPPASLIDGKEFTVTNIYEVSLLPEGRASNPLTLVEIGA
jgi:hypothetical protein